MSWIRHLDSPRLRQARLACRWRRQSRRTTPPAANPFPRKPQTSLPDALAASSPQNLETSKQTQPETKLIS